MAKSAIQENHREASDKMLNGVTTLPKEHYEALDRYIDGLEDQQGSLIHVLHKAQDLFGYLPHEVQLYIARKLGISGAKVFGVVSFYSYFTMTPVGKYKISVCMGTACFVRKADKVLDAFKEELSLENGETTEDGLFTLLDVRCVGACGLAPVVFINDQVYGHVTVEDVGELLNKCRKEHENDQG